MTGRAEELLAWEQAYRRFETPEQERRKFTQRLLRFGADRWPADAEVLELFCGRGNGLRALEELGLRRLEGVDLSPTLLAEYRGCAEVTVGDCRRLPQASSSKDYVVVHGGLHHLDDVPGDLDRTLAEARRVLRPDGLLAVVEPWPTPFLSLVHLACRIRPARRLWGRLDALATMIDHEAETYGRWLGRPAEILATLDRHFETVRRRIALGKLVFLGRPRAAAQGNQ